MSRDFLRRLVQEPLLHFTLVGALIFGFYASRAEIDAVDMSRGVIEITPDMSARLSGQFRAVWNRDPTADEFEGLIAEYIREEILYREALALGLDRDDAVIRQRMRLKMEFLSEGMAGSLVPDDATLSAWFAARVEDFTPPPTVTFLQVPIAETDDAAALIARLEGGADPTGVGRGSLLPLSLEDAVPTVVDGNFGPGFQAALDGLPEGRWAGPVASAYGPHLVKVIARTRATAPALDDVRDAVLDAWRREQAQALRQAQYEGLAARYRIVRSDGPSE